MKKLLLWCGIAALSLLPISLLAQEEEDLELMELSLEELLNVEIEIASAGGKKGLTSRESPGIVSLLTREEILNAGCRDMIDVLRLIPGFEFGQDVQGVVGLMVRGNWAIEGKVLVMLDGVEMNELLYGTTQFGNDFSIDHIKRVEVIRGPGSASYGGFAELAVINIITMTADDKEGVRASGTFGRGTSANMRQTASASVLQKIGDVALSLHLFGGTGIRSDRDFVDSEGNTFNMSEHQLNPLSANLGIKYEGFSARIVYNDYNQPNRNYFGTVLEEVLNPYSFRTIGIDLKQKIEIGEDLVLTPRIRYKSSTPWKATDIVNYTGGGEETGIFHQSVTRLTGGLTGLYTVSKDISITAGAEYYIDEARAHNSGITDADAALGNSFDFEGLEALSYNNVSLFAQASFSTLLGNVVIGGRFDNHSEFNSVFVPRFALTKAFDKFHVKLLASQAFRAPVLWNIQLPLVEELTPIQPEIATVFEVEAGYQLSDKMFISGNIFHISIQDPIVYSIIGDADGNLRETYLNAGKTGTQGFEVEYRIRDSWGYATLNYSYSMVNNSDVEEYAVAGIDESGTAVDVSNVMLGAVPHKISFNASFNLAKGITFNPSGQFYSSRWGVVGFSDDDENILRQYESVLMLNAFFRFENVLVDGLSLGVGVYDILGANYDFLQPYNGGMMPMPGPGREFLIRFGYEI